MLKSEAILMGSPTEEQGIPPHYLSSVMNMQRRPVEVQGFLIVNYWLHREKVI
jgi:hypothetical protein